MAFNQKEYINNYNKEHYYSPRIRLPKHYQDILKAISEVEGMSITAVIKNCIDEKCQNLNIDISDRS